MSGKISKSSSHIQAQPVVLKTKTGKYVVKPALLGAVVVKLQLKPQADNELHSHCAIIISGVCKV